ncbi:competence/damage-inducible protein A [Lapidilactobacillus mulanensis]|uniref:Putative competence-damage inducible protein n=1 Tax=Lapidilactobacillus mulanensis TaxID=2485999 RepID=A0ABW4DNG7_9LACO|nr:competence/damage-inducible protein A [Lapidilactobacillus mulanensis]
MQAEIIAVGTEILLGEIVNTNAQYVAKLLARFGIPSFYQTVVGDNPARLTETLALEEKRSDLIFLIGGLGPTPDDLTKQTLAAHLGRKLVTDQAALDKLVAWQKQINKVMPANNLAQAYYLEGGQVLTNEIGLAIGCYLVDADHHYFILPGPPREMLPMVDHQVEAKLAALTGSKQVIVSKMLRFFGIGESLLADKLADLIASQQNPTIATYIKGFEIGVRITARAGNVDTGNTLIAPVAAKVQSRLAGFYTGEGEERNLVQEVVDQLKQQHLTVTAAESLTAGEFQSELASVSGASNIFKGGFVTYSDAVKTQLLRIPAEVIAKHTVVSAPVAELMAEKSREILGADFGLGFTGVAGPDELEGQPVGTVFIALAQRDQPTKVQEFHLAGQRNEIRGRAVYSGFKLLYDRLLK